MNLGRGLDKSGGRKPDSRGGIPSGKDKGQDGTKGVSGKGGIQEKSKGRGDGQGDGRTEN